MTRSSFWFSLENQRTKERLLAFDNDSFTILVATQCTTRVAFNVSLWGTKTHQKTIYDEKWWQFRIYIICPILYGDDFCPSQMYFSPFSIQKILSASICSKCNLLALFELLIWVKTESLLLSSAKFSILPQMIFCLTKNFEFHGKLLFYGIFANSKNWPRRNCNRFVVSYRKLLFLKKSMPFT